MIGWTLGLDIDEYHAGPGVSSSTIKKMASRTPAHVLANVQENKPAFVLGRAAHTAVLEPDQFESRYMLGEDIRRGTKAWDAMEIAAAGREVLKPQDWDLALRLRDAVWEHPLASVILGSGGRTEASGFWTDPATEELCKFRPDYHDAAQRIAADLKTTTDMASFRRTASDYGLHIQQAWYETGFEALDEPIESWFFIAVEKEPPYLVGVSCLTRAAVDLGREVCRTQLDRYHECKTSGIWPGYPDLIELDLPAWAYK